MKTVGTLHTTPWRNPEPRQARGRPDTYTSFSTHASFFSHSWIFEHAGHRNSNTIPDSDSNLIVSVLRPVGTLLPKWGRRIMIAGIPRALQWTDQRIAECPEGKARWLVAIPRLITIPAGDGLYPAVGVWI